MAVVSESWDLPPQPRRWTADDYMRAAEAGVFAPDERLELLDGEIVYKVSPQGVRHIQAINRITKWLIRALPPEMDFLIQSTTRMTPSSVPEPDIAVLRKSVDDLSELPNGDDLALVVEVSDTTLSTDRIKKARICASAGIPEYWIVNLSVRVVEVYREPTSDGYKLIRPCGPSEQITPLFGDAPVFVSDLLPRE